MSAYTSSGRSDSLEDRIYEASVLPEFWPGVLASLAAGSSCADAIIFAIQGADVRFVASSAEYEVAAREFFTRFPDNERTRYLSTAPRAGFISDYEAFGFDQREALPIYGDFMIPRG